MLRVQINLLTYLSAYWRNESELVCKDKMMYDSEQLVI